MGQLGRRSWNAAPATLVVVGSLAAATLVVALVEGATTVGAELVYLVSVVFAATVAGTPAAAVTSIAGVVLYDVLFVEPRFMLTVDDPQEWVNLLVFLFVSLVVGRLAGLQTERREEALRRAREAETVAAAARALASGPRVAEAAPAVLEALREAAGMSRLWLGLGETVEQERVAADTAAASPSPGAASIVSLRRATADRPAEWVRLHAGRRGRGRIDAEEQLFRVAVEAEGAPLGSLWATRPRDAGLPGRGETRVLASGSDQLALAIRRERLAQEATDAEVARRSDELKSALLDSVSHDLRTPLASIRAAAGGLTDPAVTWDPSEARAVAAAIDDEAERLASLVRNLLDLSRIEGGALRPELSPYPLGDIAEGAVVRLAPVLGDRRVDVEVDPDLPPALVDAVLLDEILGNLLENAARHTRVGGTIRICADRPLPERIALLVEDDGPGVPEPLQARLFDKFYRVPVRGEGSRRGMGIGLSVVRGLTEAMGGTVSAATSALGGLAIRLDLPVAAVPSSLDEERTEGPAG